MLIQILLIKKELIKFCNNFDIEDLPKINLKIGYDRCIAREFDPNNINKRCIHKSFKNKLCMEHLLYSKYGYINEYPSNNIIKLYNQNSIDLYCNNYKPIDGPIIFTNKLNLPKKIKIKIKIKINKNLKVKNKINHNYNSEKKMDFDTIRNTEQYTGIISSISKEDNKEIMTKIAEKKLKDMFDIQFSIREYEQLQYDIDNFKNKENDDDLYKKENIDFDKKKIKDIDINELDTITIVDNDYNTCDVYIYPDDVTSNINGHWDSCLLLNEKKNIIGECRDWKDDEDVPGEYKVNNIVLNPVDGMPIMEVEIFVGATASFANLNPGIYREYNYDEEWDVFKETNNIIRE